MMPGVFIAVVPSTASIINHISRFSQLCDRISDGIWWYIQQFSGNSCSFPFSRIQATKFYYLNLVFFCNFCGQQGVVVVREVVCLGAAFSIQMIICNEETKERTNVLPFYFIPVVFFHFIVLVYLRLNYFFINIAYIINIITFIKLCLLRGLHTISSNFCSNYFCFRTFHLHSNG